MISSSRIIKATQVLQAPLAAPVEVIPNGSTLAGAEALIHSAGLEGAQQAVLAEAIGQSQHILEQARAEAETLVRSAEEQAAAVRAQAQRAGVEMAEAETSQLLVTAQGVLDEMSAWKRDLLRHHERFVLDLVETMARALFGEGMTLERDLLHATFARALAEAKPLGDVRIHVNPDDAALLDTHWPVQQSIQLGQKLELLPDAAIRRGGCLVQGEYGAVDARIETQVQAAMDTLRNVEVQSTD
jgi:flagellar assembly protein FliH